VYPDDFNAYDSLGEALMAAGDYEGSVLNYSRSVQLNPRNDNGLKKLVELKHLLDVRAGKTL
jgi:cytochrome c-type biogenesis protein CcmH/NrfG